MPVESVVEPICCVRCALHFEDEFGQRAEAESVFVRDTGVHDRCQCERVCVPSTPTLLPHSRAVPSRIGESVFGALAMHVRPSVVHSMHLCPPAVHICRPFKGVDVVAHLEMHGQRRLAVLEQLHCCERWDLIHVRH